MIKSYLIAFKITLLFLFFYSCSSEDSNTNNNNSSTNVPSDEFTISIDENPLLNTELGIIEGISNTENISFSISNDTPAGALDIVDATGQLFVKDSIPFNFEKNPILYATANVFRQYTNSNGGSEVDLIRKTTIEIHLNDVYEKYSYIGNVQLHSQQHVDDFGSENHWGVSGIFLVGNNQGDIIDLSPLESVKHVGSFLISNLNITNLSNFSNIIDIENSLRISDNNELQSLEGLSNNITIGKDLDISDNNQLIDLSALNSIVEIRNNLTFYHNVSLPSLDGLENITKVGGFVSIYSHSSLTDINGLSSLQTVDGHLSINNNGLLSNLCGIETLINNKGLSGEYIVESNMYNPTQQDIMEGNCIN